MYLWLDFESLFWLTLNRKKKKENQERCFDIKVFEYFFCHFSSFKTGPIRFTGNENESIALLFDM